jgi:hypothetical protein
LWNAIRAGMTSLAGESGRRVVIVEAKEKGM